MSPRPLRWRFPLLAGPLAAPALLWILSGAVPVTDPDPEEDGVGPRTGAERSEWVRSTRHVEILEFLDEVRARSDRIRIGELGPTTEGRPNPVVFLGAPPRVDPAAARDPASPTILILASVHGNERSGAEAALQLIRELALTDAGDVLQDVNVIVVPNANPDGAEANRRENALGYDLNRDWIVAETPEVRAVLESLVIPFRPDVFVDVHNGGSYPYHLTFQTTLDPAADAELVAFARGPVYDAVRSRLEDRGMRMHWYSGPGWDEESATWFWRTTDPWPRKQHSYGGLRDMVTLLYEVPRAHPPGLGAEAAREGLLALIEFVAENPGPVRETVSGARHRTLASPSEDVFLELRPVAREELDAFLVVRDETGRATAPREVAGEDRTLYVPARTRPAPWGYALAAEAVEAVSLLRRHGFEVETLANDAPAAVEAFRVESVVRASSRYQNRWLTRVEVTLDPGEAVLPAGTHLIRVTQPGGRLVPQLLEPDAVDSLARWNLFDDFLFPPGGAAGSVPVLRLLERPAGTRTFLQP